MTVLLDPPPGTQPGLPKASPGFLVHTSGPTDLDVLRPREGKRQEVGGPGEYEIGGVSLIGLSAGSTTVMRIDIDDIRVVAAGKLTKQLSNEEIDLLGHIDLLLIPVGGTDALDTAHAVKLVHSLEPSYVVPISASIPTPEDPDPVTKFAKELGALDASLVPQPKLVISGPTGETNDIKVIILEAK
jgi:L-ascorbate metabolism protein UlaG (beta-lactamase superfamily)